MAELLGKEVKALSHPLEGGIPGELPSQISPRWTVMKGGNNPLVHWCPEQQHLNDFHSLIHWEMELVKDVVCAPNRDGDSMVAVH